MNRFISGEPHSDRDGAEDTAREVQEQGRCAVVAQLDVTDFANAADTVETLARELGGVDVFVNNAGGTRSRRRLPSWHVRTRATRPAARSW